MTKLILILFRKITKILNYLRNRDKKSIFLILLSIIVILFSIYLFYQIIEVDGGVLNIIAFLIAIFIGSLFLHISIFSIIKKGLFGSILRDQFSLLLKEQSIVLYIVPFFLFLVILFYIENNILYLDSTKPININANISDIDVELTGVFFNTVFSNLGAAGVFAASAKIAAALVSKHPMSLPSKIGVIGGLSTGFTATFKIINASFTNSSSTYTLPRGIAKLKIVVNEIELKNPEGSDTKNLLKNWLENTNYSNKQFSINELKDKIEIFANKDESSKFISELNKNDPNWADKFINSALENGDVLNLAFKEYIIEILTTNILLHLVMMYLLFMLIIIYTSKIILEKKINFDKLKEYPLGKMTHYILIKLINIWRLNADIWVYLILISLFIFTGASAYSFYLILSVLN